MRDLVLNRTEVEAAARPTRLDRAIGSVFPRWGQRRIQARREFAWEGAVVSRLRTSGNRLQGPEDYTVFPDRLQLIKNVRDLEQNFGMMQSIIDKLALYAFGRIKYRARLGDTGLNTSYEQYLEDRFAELDITGRSNFQQLVTIAFKSMLRDGDFLFKWQRADDGKLYLSGIEGDRLGGIYMQSGSEDYFQGIKIDVKTGRPISYRCFQRTKANAYINPVDVPAVDAIHLFDPRRVDQYRGITPFAPIVPEMRDIKEVMEDCRIGTKFENRHAAIGYTPSGLPINDPASIINGSETDSNGAPLKEQEIKAGLIQWAPSNSKFEFIKSERPSGQFQTYLETLIRTMGMALNIPYGFLYNLSTLNGPAARMDAQQAHRVLETHKVNVRDRVLERVKNTLLMEGFASGEIKYSPNWRRGVWQFPPAISIDAGRDSQAAIKEVAAGLLSKDMWYAELGQDASDEADIIAEEARGTIRRAQALAKETGVTFYEAIQLLEIRTPNGYVAPAQDVPVTTDEATAAASAPSDVEAIVQMEKRLHDRIEMQRNEKQPINVTVQAPAPSPAPRINFDAGAIKLEVPPRNRVYGVRRDKNGRLAALIPHE